MIRPRPVLSDPPPFFGYLPDPGSQAESQGVGGGEGYDVGSEEIQRLEQSLKVQEPRHSKAHQEDKKTPLLYI